MSIALFTIIGATIKAGAGYWICFGFYCFFKFCKLLVKVSNASEKEKK